MSEETTTTTVADVEKWLDSMVGAPMQELLRDVLKALTNPQRKAEPMLCQKIEEVLVLLEETEDARRDN